MNISVTDKVKDTFFSVAPEVWGKKDVFVNYFMIRNAATDRWALVDAGLKWSAPGILHMAGTLFGQGSKPSAIILTHGHFDHVGALAELLDVWDVPVYAHVMELPYLTGASSYPPADPSVGGGMMSAMSFMYPAGPIDIRDKVQKLPSDGSIPGFEEWKYIETPGHSPGHISLFRESDRTLIAGDALVTTKAESAFYALTFKEQLSGPPKYFTCDWEAAKTSVLKIMDLRPEIIATGHGHPMQGEHMREQLEYLNKNFDQIAEPSHGRYVHKPAVTNKFGVAVLPQKKERIPLLIKITSLTALLYVSALLLTSILTVKRRAQE